MPFTAINPVPGSSPGRIPPVPHPLRFDVFTLVFEISCLARRCFILYLVDHLLYDILGSYIKVGGEDGGVLFWN